MTRRRSCADRSINFILAMGRTQTGQQPSPGVESMSRMSLPSGDLCIEGQQENPSPPCLPKSSALSASPLRLHTNSLVTVTTAGSHEHLQDAALAHPSTKQSPWCVCILRGILWCHHQANALGLGAWRKLQTTAESWSRKKLVRFGNISFTQLLRKTIRRDGC